MRSIVFIILIAVATSSCNYFGGKKIYGNKKQVSRDIEVSSFNHVSTAGNIAIRVSQSPTHTVRVDTDENLVEYLDIFTDGDELVVKAKQGFNPVPSKELVVYVGAPNYNSIVGSGSVNIRSENTITSADKLHIEISGSGEMQLSVKAPTLSSEISGSGTMVLSGVVENFSAAVNGSGDIKSFDLQTNVAEVGLNGSADAEVTVAKFLQIDISGSGSVHYKGNPSVKQQVSGSGRIEKVG